MENKNEVPQQEDDRVTWAEFHEFFAKQNPHPAVRNSAIQVSGWQKRKEAKKLKPNPKLRIIFTVDEEFPPYTREEFEGIKAEYAEFERRRQENSK